MYTTGVPIYVIPPTCDANNSVGMYDILTGGSFVANMPSHQSSFTVIISYDAPEPPPSPQGVYIALVYMSWFHYFQHENLKIILAQFDRDASEYRVFYFVSHISARAGNIIIIDHPNARRQIIDVNATGLN